MHYVCKVCKVHFAHTHSDLLRMRHVLLPGHQYVLQKSKIQTRTVFSAEFYSTFILLSVVGHPKSGVHNPLKVCSQAKKTLCAHLCTVCTVCSQPANVTVTTSFLYSLPHVSDPSNEVVSAADRVHGLEHCESSALPDSQLTLLTSNKGLWIYWTC